jgi:3-deoxy-D-manno-octulosonic-acid transferase
LRFLYNIGIYLYPILIRLAAPFNEKARLWIMGRKDLFAHIEKKLSSNDKKTAWFHCASLGEFEQARPVMEAFRKKYTDYKIVLTFFSPSGFEIRKNYEGADYIFYLPSATASNARRFIALIKPSIVFFVKYEFWYHYISQLKENKIPVILFSAIFRKDQIFFQWYGNFYKEILKKYEHLFVQNKESFELLHANNIKNVTVAGDTRFDRVKSICDQKKDIPLVAAFKSGKNLLVAGSTWRPDIEVLLPLINNTMLDLKVIIAPHEISEANILQIEKGCTKKYIRFSTSNPDTISSYDVLIIDNIGMLSSLYQYGEYAYIGGAFGKGLHNILEAATFGMPLFFGPRYQKFNEAKELVSKGAAISMRNKEALSSAFIKLYQNAQERQKLSEISSAYVKENTGATQAIMTYLLDQHNL